VNSDLLIDKLFLAHRAPCTTVSPVSLFSLDLEEQVSDLATRCLLRAYIATSLFALVLILQALLLSTLCSGGARILQQGIPSIKTFVM
jgi:hypothetical protein